MCDVQQFCRQAVLLPLCRSHTQVCGHLSSFQENHTLTITNILLPGTKNYPPYTQSTIPHTQRAERNGLLSTPTSALCALPHLPLTCGGLNATLQTTIQERCSHWLDACAEESKTAVTVVLEKVSTLRDLAACRDAVWQLICGVADVRCVLFMAVLSCKKGVRVGRTLWPCYLCVAAERCSVAVVR